MAEPRPAAPTPVILNVNDNEAALYLISVLLRGSGFDVIEARSGLAALESVALHAPDLVVLDMRLPDLDGLEVCRRLRENPQTASVKVLHTSAIHVSLDSKVQSLIGGADGYLSQPFEPEELIATVQSLLRLGQVERELRAVAEQLREADRRKNEFLAMLAHELRNPLAAIASSLGLLGLRDTHNASERRARDVLTRQTQHLARLVDDLLDVARVTRGKIELKREPIDLAALLSRAVENARQTKTGPRRQSLALTLPAAPVQIHGDVTRLEQVFTNLLDNASKYTAAAGQIQVTLECSTQARVIVRDDGSGIVGDMLPKIFTLFSQADVPIARSAGGLGVGLTLVQSLVELHGGSVSAASEGPGRGSQFEVCLPLAALPAEQPSPISSATPSGERKCDPKRRVLLVEDNPDALEVLSELLVLWGHEVQAVPNGLLGVDRALEMCPDVAFIDIGLPGIDGYEVARRIRAQPQGRALRLVALTGYGAPEQRQRALDAGFDLHLVKPIQPEGLARLLAES
jgi:signal transduction histidine kinase